METRDYFAAHAPVEIPPWFKHEPEPNKPTPPDIESLLEELRNEAFSWRADPCYDLGPEDGPELVQFQKQYRIHWDQLAVWQRADEIQRYIQWRWKYADLMMADPGYCCD